MLRKKNILIAIIVALVTAYYSFVTNIAPNYIKQFIPVVEVMAQDYIHGTVKIGDVKWHGGLSVQIDDVVLKDNVQNKVAVLPQTVLHLRPWLALGGVEKALAGIELSKPEVFLTMDTKQQWNLQHFLKPSDSTETPFYGLVEVKNGLLHVAMPGGKWSLPVNGEVNGGANPQFGINVTLNAEGNEINLHGLVTKDGIGTLSLKTASVDLEKYAVVAKYLENIQDSAGLVQNLHLRWNNNGKRIQIDGEGKLQATNRS